MRKPVRADPDQMNYIQVRLPGWLKNEVLDLCESQGASLNGWLVEAVRAAVRSERGLPEPPPARVPLPTPADEIRQWALGETIMTPCGQTGTCPGTLGDTWDHDGMTFCRECQIRVA